MHHQIPPTSRLPPRAAATRFSQWRPLLSTPTPRWISAVATFLITWPSVARASLLSSAAMISSKRRPLQSSPPGGRSPLRSPRPSRPPLPGKRHQKSLHSSLFDASKAAHG